MQQLQLVPVKQHLELLQKLHLHNIFYKQVKPFAEVASSVRSLQMCVCVCVCVTRDLREVFSNRCVSIISDVTLLCCVSWRQRW